MGYERVPTSKEVFSVIMARHQKELRVFESYSNPDGHCHFGGGLA